MLSAKGQQELRDAIVLYGTAAGLGQPGARHRRIAMHIRRGDKHSLYAKHMRNASWRVSSESFEKWGRRVGAQLGAERALYMTDSKEAMDSLEDSGPDSPLSTPDEDEGQLSLRFHAAARQSTLASIAREMDLAALVTSQPGMDVASNDSVMSDLVESLVAALYLDGGIDPVRAFVLARWPLDAAAPAATEKDAK